MLLALSGLRDAAAQPSDPVARARASLTGRASELGLRPDLADLPLVGVRRGKAGDYVRFQQTYGGVPVTGADVVVLVPPGGRTPLVQSRYEPGLRPPRVTLRASGADAVLTALRSLSAAAAQLRGQPTVESAYFQSGKEMVLGWRVVLPLTAPLGTWLVAVRADTGAVLFTTDLLRYDSGRVFDPNPAKTSVGAIPPPTDCDSVSNEAALSGQYAVRTFQGITPAQNKLKGEFVDLTAPGITGGYKAAGQANEPSHSYVYPCNNDRFEEAMVYYHVDSVQRKIQSLGYSGATGIFDRPIAAHAHYFSDCNAFYDSVNRGLHFGDGTGCTYKTDAAEDADVIVHEYGHALQDDLVPGWGVGSASQAEQAWAMGEGFGDFMAAVTFGDPCIGEWFSFGGACLRNLENTNHYPEAFDACRQAPPQPAEPHCAGLIWGGALWDLVQALGSDQTARDIVLTLVLEGHFSLDPLSTFAEAAAAIRQADSLLYNGMHIPTIDSVFSARGISSLGAVIDFPYAYLRIIHSFPSDLDLQLKVGSVSVPLCTQNVLDPDSTPPFLAPDLAGYEDLSASPCAAFLPPAAGQPWFLEMRDVFSQDVGTLEEFEIMLSGTQRCVATDVPVAIPDNDGFVYSSVDCSTVISAGAGADDDGDGFSAAVETYVGTNSLAPCGNAGWPADLLSEGPSANRLDLQDVGSYVAPLPHLNTSPGETWFDRRWDIVPGAGAFVDVINIQDIGQLIVLAPPMLGYQTAFNQTCPSPP